MKYKYTNSQTNTFQAIKILLSLLARKSRESTSKWWIDSRVKNDIHVHVIEYLFKLILRKMIDTI